MLEEKEITQKEIAEKLNVTQENVSQVISGKIKKSPAIHEEIAVLLEVNVYELFPWYEKE